MLTRKISKAGRQGRVSAEIVERIRTGITDGTLTAGEKLPAERDLAQRLSVSRVSVREAYRSLAEMGVLTVKRGAEGGAFIKDVDHEPVSRSLSLVLRLGGASLEELTEARLLIEPHVARLAAERAETIDVESLRSLIRNHESAIRANDNPRVHSVHFHRVIAECTKNFPLIILMNSMADLILDAVAKIELESDVHRHALGSHAGIAEAISRRDGESAYQLMRSHIEDIQKRLGKALARRR